jgi:Lar family restriction alleviation protein
MTPTNQRAVEELAACPFCGGAAEVYFNRNAQVGSVSVECRGCQNGTGYWRTEKTAIDRWNRRTPGWRPISEAPRDGTRVMVFDPTLNGGFVCTARFWEGHWWGHSIGLDEMFPTKWQPLPPPPGEAE